MSSAWETNASSEGRYVSRLTCLLFLLCISLFGGAAEYDKYRDAGAFVTVVYEISSFYRRSSSL